MARDDSEAGNEAMMLGMLTGALMILPDDPSPALRVVEVRDEDEGDGPSLIVAAPGILRSDYRVTVERIPGTEREEWTDGDA